MASSGASEKTEQATPKKKRDERKKGNVFSSKDLVSAFFIILIFFAIKVCSKLMYTTLYNSMIFWLNKCDGSFEISDSALTHILIEVVKAFVIVAGPIMLVSIVVNILFTGAQTGFIFSKEALKPKFSRMNPIEGIKKLFSLRTVVETIKSILKITIIASIIYSKISGSIKDIARLYDVDILSAIAYLCSTIFSTVMSIGIVFIGLGIFDLLYQWWDYEKTMKMTKQEVKEEYKQMEGDPQIKGRIRQIQREMAQRRMMQEVPKADVIIRNPTHFAIAIKYNPEQNIAPIVIAKGADNVAMKIIEIAAENNITMTENKPLARALYDEVDLGREIPAVFYQEVAEVLAWVYDLKNKTLKY